ncbi:MAG: hypothetical protein MCSN_6420 [Candidatus Microsyncoccus archaeolyticus]|nr:MAG: hypothetical protein MCSN_6420 [Candidatus Parcubacteria bacterium]
MKNSFQKGLTLVEMLIVISIAVLFSAMVFGNYNVGKEGLALERAAQKLSQDLRRAQEMGLSGYFPTGFNAAGLYFDESSPATSYILYNNSTSDATNYYYQSSTDSIRETINIETGIKICNIIDDDNGSITYPTTRSVSFAPPEPVTRIENDNTLHNVSIVLCIISDNTKTRTININNVGRIDVNNP